MSVAIAEPHYEPTRVIVLDRRTGAPVGGVDLIVGLHDPTTGALPITISCSNKQTNVCSCHTGDLHSCP